MTSKSNVAKRGTPRRRKIALACEACRDKKVRCDGEKPICGPCARRSYTIEQCVYKIENARSASNDAYLKVLHDRIRELEETCARNGVSVPRASSREIEEAQSRAHRASREPQSSSNTLITESRTSVPAEELLGSSSTTPFGNFRQASLTSMLSPPAPPLQTARASVHSIEGQRKKSEDLFGTSRENPTVRNVYLSPSLNSHGNVTAMGAISAGDDGECTDSPRDQYYGNSSVASFMRLAGDSIPIQSYLQTLKRMGGDTPGTSYRDAGLWRDINFPTSGLQFDDFSLPPRPLADHLLECYWNRVYCLYPIFHRPSFEQAYENLWGSSKWPKPKLPELNIGLGGAFDSGHQSIVFHCALNAIFSLGCHFSDIPAAEREAAAYSFFLRSKRFVGLDLLDTGTIGVVQTLLIISLLLQSTPYPNRCWNAIGVACRVALGLGLHETTTQTSLKPLEKEIRRRTWHGCVIMDMIVSMTFGRPSMTSHVSPTPLPVMAPQSKSDDPCELSGQSCDHQLGHMTFYVSTIELYKILESILSDIYKAWQSHSNHHRPTSLRDSKHSSLDVIMELDDKLSSYEANVAPVLNWTNRRTAHRSTGQQGSLFERQRNVLRARFIHLRLLLYRPMFTQLCSDERAGLTRQTGPEANKSTPRQEKNVIYSSMSVNCAAACAKAAMELVSLVYETYRTSLTDAWWYNGFYTSTAGFVLMMSYTCRSILDQIDEHAVDTAWQRCEEILTNMASFSLSARNSLQFLQVTHHYIMQKYKEASRSEDAHAFAPSQPQIPERSVRQHATSSAHTVHMSEDSILQDPQPNNAFNINPFMSWDEMGLGQEEFGFLGRFDVPDLASWFSDIPDIS